MKTNKELNDMVNSLARIVEDLIKKVDRLEDLVRILDNRTSSMQVIGPGLPRRQRSLSGVELEEMRDRIAQIRPELKPDLKFKK